MLLWKFLPQLLALLELSHVRKILIGPATLNGLPVKMQVWYIKRRMDLLLFCYLTILAVFNCLLVTLIKLVTQLA